MSTLVQYTMCGQLLTNSGPNAYQFVYWDVYTTPDYAGASSGYSGQLQNIRIASSINVSDPAIGAPPPNGYVLNATPSASGSVQTLLRLPWQIQIVDMSGGSFTQPLPVSPWYGDRVDLLDPATSPSGGVYAHPCTVSGGTNTVQDAQLKTLSTTQTFGFVANTSAQWVGGSYWPLLWVGTFWKSLA